MNQYRIRLINNQFVIDGLPEDAVKVISFRDLLPGHSRNLWSLAAHRVDLNSAKAGLNRINDVEEDLRLALWQTAIVSYCKCFSQTNKQGARKPLEPNKTLDAGQPRDIHRWFMSLRNMNVAHDENAWLRALPGAVIAAPDKGHSVEDVICLTFEGQSLKQENFGNLNLLIDSALKWVESEFNKLCTIISDALEKMPRETLIDQPDVTYRPPGGSEVDQPRPPA
jgi:hypothetical protein